MYTRRIEHSGNRFLAHLRFQEISKQYKNFTRMSPINFEYLFNLVKKYRTQYVKLILSGLKKNSVVYHLDALFCYPVPYARLWRLRDVGTIRHYAVTIWPYKCAKRHTIAFGNINSKAWILHPYIMFKESSYIL